MAAVANIVLPDAQATPQNHTFIPVGQGNNGEWIFEDQSSGQPLFYPRLTISANRPAPASVNEGGTGRVVRVPYTLAIPVSDGAVIDPKVAHILRAQGTMIIPESASLQSKKDLAKYVSGLLQNSQFLDCVVSFTKPY